jgi:hypothetical protein
VLANTGVDQGSCDSRALIRDGPSVVGPSETSILKKRYASYIEKWLFENTTLCLIFVSVAK